MTKNDLQSLKTGDTVEVNTKYGWVTRIVDKVYKDAITIKAMCFADVGYYGNRSVRKPSM